MTIEQTVDIPADRRLVIDVPREVPTGRVILTFTPAASPAKLAVDDSLEGECPLCAKHRDPITGNPRYNAETVAAMQEARDIMAGKKPVEWNHSIERARKELGL